MRFGRWSLLCVAAGLALAGCGGKKQAGGAPQMQAMPVVVQPVTLKSVNDYTEYVGTIQSLGSSVVQSLVEGYVTKIDVHSGQRVSAGTPLMQIDPARQEATVNNAEATVRQQQAQVDLARTNLDRTKALASAGVVAKQELDNAQTAYDSAVANLNALRANVNQQQTQLRYYAIKAATAGTVGDIPVRLGDHVTTSTLLTTLDTGGGLEDYIYIPAERAAGVKIGTPVILVAEDGTEVQSKITFVSPRMDPQSQLLLVKAAVPAGDARFRNQQTVHTRVVWRQYQAPLVPVIDVSRQSNAVFAFVVGKNDKGQDIAQQRALQTSGIQGNDYVVKDGVKPGEQLITTSVQLLADGMPVKPVQPPPQGGAPAPAGTAGQGGQ
jgi:RND family efflux transporter MFP subunit